ncbi:MAG TPA: thioredoxin domain-containing protein, partial [Myxococcota bacterium]|nr:thioredoxin domain-containing protein [Myxococcota bacterium]
MAVKSAPTTGLAEALRAKGPGYAPRTRHLEPDGSPTYTNRLILETSPYLLQHAHNPVDWYTWGDAAFARARAESRPVFLSIGYSTCHWCHVMERESFEDEEIARILNEHFVAIKVDREERPDIDALYMNAVLLFSGSGGWPMTVFLTPDRQPFFAGTYFPPRDGERGATYGLLSLLRALRDEYARAPARIATAARLATERLQATARPAPPGAVPGVAAIQAAVAELARGFDPNHGGFHAAPKFPMPTTLELLMRHHRRSGDAQALSMLVRTLERMAAGGIHDQIGGGFHRYATDDAWLVPHFEKMLYDNAQLAVVYLEASQLTGREDFAQVARGTLDYVLREMSDPAGGFYSATDADSPVPGAGRETEGWYFTWTPRELEATLGPDLSRVAAAYYGVDAQGQLEGRSVLHTPRPPDQVAAGLGLSPAEVRTALARARQELYAARQRRPPPARDGKVIAAWNGLMISALSRGAQVLGEPRYAERAARAAGFVLGHMRSGQGLDRTWMSGVSRNPGTLSDHACLVQGLLDLYETSHDVSWLSAALALQRHLELHFWDEAHGGYYQTSDQHEELLVRGRADADGAEPSGNAVAILNLLRLAELTGDDHLRDLAARALRAAAAQLERGLGAAKLLCALDHDLDGPVAGDALHQFQRH